MLKNCAVNYYFELMFFSLLKKIKKKKKINAPILADYCILNGIFKHSR